MKRKSPNTWFGFKEKDIGRTKSKRKGGGEVRTNKLDWRNRGKTYRQDAMGKDLSAGRHGERPIGRSPWGKTYRQDAERRWKLFNFLFIIIYKNENKKDTNKV